MQNGLGWTTLVIIFGKGILESLFERFLKFGRPWGSEWEPVGTTFADRLPSKRIVYRFLIQFWEGPNGRGGGLLSLRICRIWDDLNHAATPARVQRILQNLKA